MKSLYRIAPIVLIGLMVSCSGGGPSGTTIIPEPPGGSSNLAGSFNPDQPNPGDGTIRLSEGGSSDSLVGVQVDITGVQNIFAADFDIIYDPSLADYLSFLPGTLLESGGQNVIYLIEENVPGRIVVGIARQGGDSGGVDVTSTQTLVTFTFQVTVVGTSSMSLQDGSLDDATRTPIPGLAWAGGTLIAN